MASESSSTSLANQPSTGVISSLKHNNNLIAINVAAQLPVKLTPENYPSWKAQFDALLYGYDLLCFIDGTKPCPLETISVAGKESPNPDFVLWQRHDKLLSLGIIGSLSDRIIPQVTTLKTSAEAWNRLTKYYANSLSSRSMGLTEQLISIS
ncbi:hypothetical protein JRO89_XS05G0106500 [Xanthoceras sorbifolium]|uniref:Gag-pol polyprotein n=1 Tax=Xanthoceras sorbifolium TaxID=99658 RepID=A0ABQ8I1E4_9ROSI|nr:hypothetical protein JRO89_XS05G0106500 [Xanthoceras sorbifolium]